MLVLLLLLSLHLLSLSLCVPLVVPLLLALVLRLPLCTHFSLGPSPLIIDAFVSLHCALSCHFLLVLKSVGALPGGLGAFLLTVY